ncbi:MAG: hypothetical protein LBT65_01280 [Synergistaceae bacterium]|jgi:hypothetical protein|nr:hypothetical protein [Synergistaceae bacterium]
MGAPKKYGDRLTFTYRAERDLWEKFILIMTLKKDTPTDFITRAVKKEVEECGSLLERTVLDAMTAAKE